MIYDRTFGLITMVIGAMTLIPAAEGGVVLRQDFEGDITFANGAPPGDIPNLIAGDRFQITTQWAGPPTSSGPGPIANSMFFDQTNWQMLIRVLDSTGSETFNQSWVFSAAQPGTTYELRVGDDAQPFGVGGPTVDFLETEITDVDVFSHVPLLGTEGPIPADTFSLLFGMNGPTSIFNGLGLPTSVDFPAFTGGSLFLWTFSNGASASGTLTNWTHSVVIPAPGSAVVGVIAAFGFTRRRRRMT